MTATAPPETAKGGSNPKRHHTVAQFYLDRFATKERLELVARDD